MANINTFPSWNNTNIIWGQIGFVWAQSSLLSANYDENLVILRGTNFDLPLHPNITTKKVEGEIDIELHKAPFSKRVVVSGDGLQKPYEIKLSGIVPFQNIQSANNFIITLYQLCQSVTHIVLPITQKVVQVYSLSVAFVPNRTGQQVSVNITAFPSL